ncbi:PKD domain-containing protein [Pedobacter sp. SYP-B3415]|uniref:PKD domain-containing protein n=1 Tax=Pedobacter sp. SYP-B3415 TaxID=2496641 RepID=UPI00101D461D|nr:PKD domain-containing protein [Pedobacter sp. SYP-B3415]
MKFSDIKYTALAALLFGATFSGCKPEEFGNGNGLSSTPPATFTVTPVQGKTNTYVLKSNTDVVGVRWDRGDGSGSANGKMIDTAFYPDAGKYKITLTTIGKGGSTASTSQDVTVTSSDPVAGNLVQGARMEAGDDAKWTRLNLTPGVTWTMANGKMTAAGGNNGQQGIYQAIDVVGGKKYKVDMVVSGSGATDTWFEVYVGTAVPVQGSDYNAGGSRIALNTWAGCGKAAFSGKLSALSCSGSGNTVTFPQSGKVYLVIRTGGANLGTSGISITNVEFRGTN